MTLKKIQINSQIAIKGNIDKRLTGTVIGILAVSFALYIVFMGQTIVNIIERKNIETQTRNLSTEVSSLEIEYIALSKKVDYDLAQSLGYNDSKDTYYASRHQAMTSIIGISNEL